MKEVKKKPKVSICCLSYNHAKFIRDALDGFVMQETEFPYEILIHDDASTDGTQDILREYQGKYPEKIKLYLEKENQFSKGKNISEILYPYAEGEYIALCEGDDFWTDRSKLQRQVEYLDFHPFHSACFHKAGIISEEGFDHRLYEHLQEKDYGSNQLVLQWTIPTASFMFRRRYCTKIPKDARFMYDDIVNFLTMAENGKIHCMDRVMSMYRRHAESIIGRQNRNKSNALYRKTDRHYAALGIHFQNVSPIVIAWLRLKNQFFRLIYLVRTGF